jgi:hypothetical protein
MSKLLMSLVLVMSLFGFGCAGYVTSYPATTTTTVTTDSESGEVYGEVTTVEELQWTVVEPGVNVVVGYPYLYPYYPGYGYGYWTGGVFVVEVIDVHRWNNHWRGHHGWNHGGRGHDGKHPGKHNNQYNNGQVKGQGHGKQIQQQKVQQPQKSFNVPSGGGHSGGHHSAPVMRHK